jgi:triacylglycerol lipase
MWNSIRDETAADLKASALTKRLIITGISLGGGLAMISYVDIKHMGIFDNIEIITFGSPRVGNKNWAKWLEG